MQSPFSKDQFLQFQAAFKVRAKAGRIDAADMMLYNIIRGRDNQRGFSPITNPTKIANGALLWWGYTAAKSNLLVRVYRTKWDSKGMQKIWDPSYLKGAFGIDATEEQLQWIAKSAGWNV